MFLYLICDSLKRFIQIFNDIGVITPEGVVESTKKKVSLTDAVVKEFGFSKAVEVLCPQGWKEPLGDKWRDVLDYIIENESEESYIPIERAPIKELDPHIQYGAQKSSLTRRIYKEYHVDLEELKVLSKIYIIYLDGNKILSKVTDEHTGGVPGMWMISDNICHLKYERQILFPAASDHIRLCL